MYRQPKVQKFSLESDRNCIPQEVGMLGVKVRQVVDIRMLITVRQQMVLGKKFKKCSNF